MIGALKSIGIARPVAAIHRCAITSVGSLRSARFTFASRSFIRSFAQPQVPEGELQGCVPGPGSPGAPDLLLAIADGSRCSWRAHLLLLRRLPRTPSM